MLRGGSYYNDVGFHCRAAFRHFNLPMQAYPTLGFRMATSRLALREIAKGSIAGARAAIVSEIVAAGAMEEVYWDSLQAPVIDVPASKEKGVDTGICR